MRLLIAIWAAKAASYLGKLLGKKSTSTPGQIALKICPDIIERMKKNIKGEVFAVCGTNGKTTTNNLLCSALENLGKKVLCNKIGANMLSGIANTFVLEASIFGKLNVDCACFEIDEAFAVKVFDKIKPDVMVITNLFRDQLDRYGEVESTAALLEKAIKKCENLKLVLNADDPICASFGKGRDALYFGVAENVLNDEKIVNEGRRCPACGCELSYNYHHYSQLGDYYCPACENKRPEIDFSATNVSLEKGISFTVCNEEKISLSYRGFYNIYNFLAVYSALKASKINFESFSSLISDYKPQIGRMEEINLKKPVILNLAKNPAGFNQAISTVITDKRKKDVILSVNDCPSDGQDVSWLWDVDFEKLDDEFKNLIIVSGKRKYDLALRFKYSNIKVDDISENMRNAVQKCIDSESEVLYVLVNYTELFSTQNILLELQKEWEEKNNGKA